MKRFTAASLLLATSLCATPLRLRSIDRPSVSVVWVPIGIGLICTAAPGLIPGCGLVPGIFEWLKATTIDGVTTYQVFPLSAHDAGYFE